MSTEPTLRRTAAHAAERMRDRTSVEWVTAPIAFDRGIEIDVPVESPVPPHDEARYDPPADVVVFRRGDTLTTCYGLKPEHVTNIHGVAVAAAVDEQCGTDYRSGIDAANLEEAN